MIKYTQNENFTIWYNTDTQKYYIERRGSQLSRTGYDTAAIAIGSYYDI